jgi:hypothetical protein
MARDKTIIQHRALAPLIGVSKIAFRNFGRSSAGFAPCDNRRGRGIAKPRPQADTAGRNPSEIILRISVTGNNKRRPTFTLAMRPLYASLRQLQRLRPVITSASSTLKYSGSIFVINTSQNAIASSQGFALACNQYRHKFEKFKRLESPFRYRTETKLFQFGKNLWKTLARL